MNFPNPAQVKNKTPAAIQITAEQILREAKERQEKPQPRAQVKLNDKEELDEYRLQKRRTFEDSIKRNRVNFSSWLKYAEFEERQLDFGFL